MALAPKYNRSEAKALQKAKRQAQRAKGKAAHKDFQNYEKYGPYTAIALFEHCSTQFDIGEDYASINVAEHLDEYWPLYYVDELQNLRLMLDKAWTYAECSPKHVQRILRNTLDRETVLDGQCMNFRFVLDKAHQDLLLEWIREDYINFPDCVDVFTSNAAFDPELLVEMCGAMSTVYATESGDTEADPPTSSEEDEDD